MCPRYQRNLNADVPLRALKSFRDIPLSYKKIITLIKKEM